MLPSSVRFILLLLAVLVTATAFSAVATEELSGPVDLTVSILPQQWFAEKIGGAMVLTTVLVGPGQSPATFDPGPRQMAALQDTEVFVRAGVPFERGLLPKISAMRNGPVICGLPVEEAAAGRHDGHGHHHHGLDPHNWLDPRQASALADSMCATLCRLRPGSAGSFLGDRDRLRVQLEELDREIAGILAPHRGRKFFVFHPAFGHFAAAYGLVQVAIEDDGHEPGARHLADVIETARAEGATAIIVQPQFSRKSAEAVARSLDLDVIALDPLAADYDVNLLEIARTLAGLFERGTRP